MLADEKGHRHLGQVVVLVIQLYLYIYLFRYPEALASPVAVKVVFHGATLLILSKKSWWILCVDVGTARMRTGTNLWVESLSRFILAFMSVIYNFKIQVLLCLGNIKDDNIHK